MEPSLCHPIQPAQLTKAREDEPHQVKDVAEDVNYCDEAGDVKAVDHRKNFLNPMSRRGRSVQTDRFHLSMNTDARKGGSMVCLRYCF